MRKSNHFNASRRKSTTLGRQDEKKEKLKKILAEKLGIENIKQLILKSDNRFDREVEHH